MLTRLTERGLLTRHQDGRVASYGLTDASRRVLREGRERVGAAEPFHQVSSDWTLLSFSLPETQRDIRNRLRSRLTWAGFGCLRDGLWLAPGNVDLDRITAVGAEVEGLQIDGFVASPTPGTDVARFVRRAWDLDALRREHEEFSAVGRGPFPGTGVVGGAGPEASDDAEVDRWRAFGGLRPRDACGSGRNGRPAVASGAAHRPVGRGGGIGITAGQATAGS